MSRKLIQGIADRIMSTFMGSSKGEHAAMGLVSLPSERDVATQLDVSRHAVRVALEHMLNVGDAQRISGRMVLVINKNRSAITHTPQQPVVSCINFIQGPSLNDRALQGLLSTYLAGYHQILDRYDHKTRFVFWEDDSTSFGDLLWNRIPWNQQACVLVNRSQPELLQWLDERKIPFVVQYYRPYDTNNLPPHHKVYVNKTRAAFKATDHLLELGHQKIGFIGPIPPDSGPRELSAWCVYEGFHAAMRCAGLSSHPENILGLNVQIPEQAIDQCKVFLRKKNRPTAMLVANASMTKALMLAAASLNLKVPDDLSVVGFASPQDELSPAVTHMQLPQKELAVAAIELLMNNLEHPQEEYITRIFECELHAGSTCAPISP